MYCLYVIFVGKSQEKKTSGRILPPFIRKFLKHKTNQNTGCKN